MTLTGLLCAVVAGLSVAYAVEELRRLRSQRLFRYVGKRQAARRVFGSCLVAVLMVLVFLGFEVIEPIATPRLFILNWALAGLLAVLLFALAILDLRELRLHREREHARELDRFCRELVPGREERGPGRRPGPPA